MNWLGWLLGKKESKEDLTAEWKAKIKEQTELIQNCSRKLSDHATEGRIIQRRIVILKGDVAKLEDQIADVPEIRARELVKQVIEKENLIIANQTRLKQFEEEHQKAKTAIEAYQQKLIQWESDLKLSNLQIDLAQSRTVIKDLQQEISDYSTNLEIKAKTASRVADLDDTTEFNVYELVEAKLNKLREKK